jgi:hypothetical protein
MSRHKECVYRAEFDMETLVWTRGKRFPLSRLESRLRCPMCGVEGRYALASAASAGKGRSRPVALARSRLVT